MSIRDQGRVQEGGRVNLGAHTPPHPPLNTVPPKPFLENSLFPPSHCGSFHILTQKDLKVTTGIINYEFDEALELRRLLPYLRNVRRSGLSPFFLRQKYSTDTRADAVMNSS